MFIPKSRQLTAMGKEGIYVQVRSVNAIKCICDIVSSLQDQDDTFSLTSDSVPYIGNSKSTENGYVTGDSSYLGQTNYNIEQ